DPETGALRALLDGRFITEARTGAVSAVSSRLLARKTASSIAIIGSGVQAHSHLEALGRVHHIQHAAVWSPNRAHRESFAASHGIKAVDHAGEAVVGAAGRRSDTEITIFKSLGMAVEDVTAADLAYRRAVERNIGQQLTL